MEEINDQLEEVMFRTLEMYSQKHKELTHPQMMSFIFTKMKNDEYLFNYDRIDFFYDCVGMIQKFGYDETMNYLTSIESWENEILFTNPDYTLEKMKERDRSLRRDKIRPVIKGFKKCKGCGSDNVIDYEKQTRRADEPMTVFFICACCGQRVR
jgi:DNA-directed RNA polymerase subunit M/transcription elongation factor TFIIS